MDYQFDDFFTSLTNGESGYSDVFYRKMLTVNDREAFARQYIEFMDICGRFDSHIARSIPGHREIQVLKSLAINGSFLDLGGSEGTLANLIGKRFRAVNVDLNKEMVAHANRAKTQFAEHIQHPLFWGFGGKTPWETDEKFDFVHESMLFQFITKERPIADIKSFLKPNGVLLMEEKFYDDSEVWRRNEELKDAYKAFYFSKADIKAKKESVLTGMHKNQIPKNQLWGLLSVHFKHVAKYWHSGNFAGFAASDSLDNLLEFSNKMEHAY